MPYFRSKSCLTIIPHREQLANLDLKIRSVDSNSVCMAAEDEESSLATKSVLSLLPEFITRRLMPQRLVILPHESYLEYTRSRSER